MIRAFLCLLIVSFGLSASAEFATHAGIANLPVGSQMKFKKDFLLMANTTNTAFSSCLMHHPPQSSKERVIKKGRSFTVISNVWESDKVVVKLSEEPQLLLICQNNYLTYFLGSTSEVVDWTFPTPDEF